MNKGFDWTLLLPLGLFVFVALCCVVSDWIKRSDPHRSFEDTAADMARAYGPNWLQVACAEQPRRTRAQVIEAAARGRRNTDLSPAQQADMREQWIREEKEHFGHYYRGHIEFLLRRLDEARGVRR